MERRQRRKFTPEYKAEVVRMVRTSGKSIGQLSKELELTETAVRAWVQRADIDEKKDPNGPLTSDERAEVNRLVDQLTERNFITSYEPQVPGTFLHGRIPPVRSGVVPGLLHDEIAPVCTPLGSDCGDGAWCPPTGLTGAALACRSAGTVALGSSCAGPADCVANTACIDSGAGPVCTALCSSSDFDAPCASGGTCQRATVDYGVCTPAASMP